MTLGSSVAECEIPRLGVPISNGFHATYIETHFSREILRAVQQVAPELDSLSLLAPD